MKIIEINILTISILSYLKTKKIKSRIENKAWELIRDLNHKI